MKTCMLISSLLLSCLLASAIRTQQPLVLTNDHIVARIVQGPDDSCSVGSYGIYVYSATNPDTFLAGKVLPRDGSLVQAWIAKTPDHDTSTLLLLWTRSAGSGAYGQVEAFRFDGSELIPEPIPVPPPALLTAYRGHDQFTLTDGVLYHSFPLYSPDNPNCCPSAGRRTLSLQLGNPHWTLASETGNL